MEIEFTISKEDLYYALCEFQGGEGFTYDTFSDFDSIPRENPNQTEEYDPKPDLKLEA
jgi:hypothetical protein